MSDLDSAILLYRSYWDIGYFDKTVEADSVTAYLKYAADGSVDVVFPGSRTGTDWMRDLDAIEPAVHPVLGLAPNGFLMGIDEAYKAIKPLLPAHTHIRIHGHSLGGPRACYLGALLVHDGSPADLIDIVAFEPPHAGSESLRNLLRGVDVRLYRNGQDIVTQVPLGFMHPCAPIEIHSEPIAGDILPSRFHHIQNCIVSVVLQGAQHG